MIKKGKNKNTKIVSMMLLLLLTTTACNKKELKIENSTETGDILGETINEELEKQRHIVYTEEELMDQASDYIQNMMPLITEEEQKEIIDMVSNLPRTAEGYIKGSLRLHLKDKKENRKNTTSEFELLPEIIIVLKENDSKSVESETELDNLIYSYKGKISKFIVRENPDSKNKDQIEYLSNLKIDKYPTVAVIKDSKVKDKIEVDINKQKIRDLINNNTDKSK